MLLSIENLRVSYDRIRALHGISFGIEEGEIASIIGANGAGKSTTLRAISRLIPVEPGSRMTYREKDLLRYAPDRVVSQLGISHVPEGRRIFDNLTVIENLRLATFARKDKEAIGRDLGRIFSIFPRLEERQKQKAGTLSGGEQQMLAVGLHERKSGHASGRALHGTGASSYGRRFPVPSPDQWGRDDDPACGAERPDGPAILKKGICPGKRNPGSGRALSGSPQQPRGEENLSGGVT
jgi:ABC-type transport system involved in cytochrome c biogenesis ATPase subunit